MKRTRGFWWLGLVSVLVAFPSCSEDGPDSTNSVSPMGGDAARLDEGATADVDAGPDAGPRTFDDAAIMPPALDMAMTDDLDGARVPEGDGGTPASAENLLADPSFEQGTAAWGIWGGATRVEDDVHEGDWALRATRRNGAEQRVEGLVPNATYRLSAWGKSETDEPMLVGAKDYGGDEVRLAFRGAEYSQDSLVFTMGGAHTTAVIYAYKHDRDEPGHADALSLTLEAAPAPPEPGPELALVWSDEFDGSGPLDNTKWTYEEGFKRNRELQWYQGENAFREDGFLVIEGRRENRPNPTHVPGSDDWRTQRPSIEYTSASVITRDLFDWEYGRLEVRAKVTNYTGTWPAIWTLGVDCEWPSNGEVDVMENYGGDILANFAWGTNRRWTAQ